jgi:heat shock protein HslJ
MKIIPLLPTMLISITLFSMALAACASTPAAPSIPLEGTYWTLESLINQQGESQNTLPETVIDAIFQDGSVSGTDGCNQYGAAYETNGENISIQPGISTLMACPEPIMNQAQSYMSALASASSYKISDNTLEILNKEGKTVLTYKAGDTSLSGTSWTATSYNNGKQAVVSPLAGSEITAEFGEDGTLSGSAGCNRYTASYTVDGNSLKISPPASTRMMCATPDGVMEQEAAYLAAIQLAAVYELRGNSLTIRDADGSTLAQYVRK